MNKNTLITTLITKEMKLKKDTMLNSKIKVVNEEELSGLNTKYRHILDALRAHPTTTSTSSMENMWVFRRFG